MTGLEQGPKAGRHWPAEVETYEDDTGARVRRLTTYPDVDDWHLYFTEDGWYDDGRRLLLRSTRDGARGLYSVDLRTGLVTQVTDLPHALRGVTAGPDGEAAYCWCDGRLLAVDLDTLAVRSLYEAPEGYATGSASVSADGERVYASVSEDVSDQVDGGHHETYEAVSRSRVVAVPTDGGDHEVLVDEDAWISHVNASPTRSALLTYCHEGPWDRVDNRIWGLDAERDERWQIRPTGPDEAVGHEYWLADGEHVGYHGWAGEKDDPDAFFGTVRYDDTDRREHTAPDIYTHFHANDRSFVVCDGTRRGVPHALVWQYDPERATYDGPRKLAHTGWGDESGVHPHSRLAPDDGTVAFDSARAGSGSDVYLVDVPAFESLPPLEEGWR